MKTLSNIGVAYDKITEAIKSVNETMTDGDYGVDFSEEGKSRIRKSHALLTRARDLLSEMRK